MKKVAAAAVNLSTFRMHNHFQTLGFEPSFVQDAEALQRAYVRAQQVAHPDRQMGKSDAERQKAALASAAANDAYRVLKDDYLRAVHILELQGIRVQGDNATMKPDHALLMEVMEWNEEVEESAGSQAAMLVGKFHTVREELVAQLHIEVSPQAVIRFGYLEKTIAILTRKIKGIAA
ncbi:MAG: Fe-S protein assembly co-chaperone HscB [Rickettsiales bacterium]|nr:Fe-S protein assembly co-chaperone HscB [Rickettsiales bacterium]